MMGAGATSQLQSHRRCCEMADKHRSLDSKQHVDSELIEWAGVKLDTCTLYISQWKNSIYSLGFFFLTYYNKHA